jgi:copper chaperone CopZ
MRTVFWLPRLCRASLRSLCLFVLAAAAAVGPPAARADDSVPGVAPPPRLEFLYLAVTGAGERGKAAALEAAIGRVIGVRSFVWTQPAQEAKVVRVVGQAPTGTLAEVARSVGCALRALPIGQVTLVFVTPLHCKGCERVVKRILGELAGVKEVEVAEDGTRCWVVHDTSVARVGQMLAALEEWEKPARVDPAPPAERRG